MVLVWKLRHPAKTDVNEVSQQKEKNNDHQIKLYKYFYETKRKTICSCHSGTPVELQWPLNASSLVSTKCAVLQLLGDQ